MKVLRYLIVLGFILVISSCRTLPALYLGDTSGTLDYNRRDGQLRIVWEHHSQLIGQSESLQAADSTQVNH